MNTHRLDQARALRLPTRDAMLRRDPSVARFWSENTPLLGEAWREWEATTQDLPSLDDRLIDARLREAVDVAWDDPAAEQVVRDLWEEVTPGVYQCQFFDPARLPDLRAYLEAAGEARIPTRPPYGIVLNRGGAMLDPRSSGFHAGPSLQALYRRLFDRYFRPIARLLFPEVVGYDAQTFGFSIAYQPDTDTSIRPHTDASAATLNINLNLPDEAFGGSIVDFYHPRTGRPHPFVFAPGVAAIHRGSVAHAARPITEGERRNFVLWVYGGHGQMPPRGGQPAVVPANERWTVPSGEPDGFAPF